jgi:hypothetical protein
VPVNATSIQASLSQIRLDVIDNPSITRQSLGMIMSHAVAEGLWRLRDAGQLVLRDEIIGGSIRGAPFVTLSGHPTGGLLLTNQAGDGGGLGTLNKSDIYVADWSNITMFMAPLETTIDVAGAYTKDDGTKGSCVEDRVTNIVMHTGANLMDSLRGRSIAVLSSVDWQAI